MRWTGCSSATSIARGRLKGVGVLSAEDAVGWGVSGPSARGSGVNWDLRKHDSVLRVSALGVRRHRGRERRLLTTAAACRLFECYESARDHRAGDRADRGGPVHGRRPAAAHRAARGRRLRPHRVRTRVARRVPRLGRRAAGRYRMHVRSPGLLQPRARCLSSPADTRCPTSSSSSVRSTPCSGRWTGEHRLLVSCGDCRGGRPGVVGLVAGSPSPSPRSSACGASARSRHASRCASARRRPAPSACCRRSPTR